MPLFKKNVKKTILLVFAQKEEYDALFSNMFFSNISLSNGLELTKAKIEKCTIYAFFSGVGKSAMSYKLGLFLSIIKPDLIINIGVSGSISDKLNVYDVLVASKTCYYDADLQEFGYKYGQMSECPLYFECDKETVDYIMNFSINDQTVKSGLIITGDKFITKEKIDHKWFEYFDNPISCDMESAAVGQIAYINKIPFAIIRAISDAPNKAERNVDEYNARLNNASLKAANLVRNFLDDYAAKVK